MGGKGNIQLDLRRVKTLSCFIIVDISGSFIQMEFLFCAHMCINSSGTFFICILKKVPMDDCAIDNPNLQQTNVSMHQNLPEKPGNGQLGQSEMG